MRSADNGGRTRVAILPPWILIPGVFVVLDLALLYWVWVRPMSWGIWDWDYHASVLEVIRRSIVEFGELPLWNAYMAGGSSMIGNPLARPFSVSTLPILAFGTVVGMKVGILLYLVIGQAGMYFLAREEGLSRRAAMLAAVVLTASGCYAQHATHGHVDWGGFWWFPLLALSLRRAAVRGGELAVCAGGLVLGLLLLDGGPYQVAFTMVFLGLYVPLTALERGTPRLLITGTIVGIVGLGLAAVRLVPVADTLRQFSRPTPLARNFYGMATDPTATEMLFQAYLARDQVNDPSKWMPYVVEVGSYVGPLPLLLAGLALWRVPKRCWTSAVLLMISVWVTLGAAAPVDLWPWLHGLPIFSSLQVPARFNFFVMFALALVAAHGLDALARARWWPSGRGRHVASLVLVLVAVDLVVVNGAVFKPSYSLPPIDPGPPGAFRQYSLSPWWGKYASRALYPLYPNWPNAAFPAILQNAGVIQSQYDIRFPRLAMPFSARGYAGEVWSSHPGVVRVEDVRITPNRIAFRSDGSGGTVIVNQNYRTGWRIRPADAGTVVERQGRLAVDLARGPRTITLAFLPDAFVTGAMISLTMLGIVLFGFVLYRGKGPGRASQTAPTRA